MRKPTYMRQKSTLADEMLVAFTTVMLYIIVAFVTMFTIAGFLDYEYCGYSLNVIFTAGICNGHPPF
jgi:hypothetical protein